MNETCPGCDHLIARHYRDLNGVARCLVTASGVSTSGVIGLPWSSECDCADGVSEKANRIREREAEEERERQEWITEVVGRMKKNP